MSPLYLYNGKLLVRSGALATSASCCCDNNYYCYKSTEPIVCPCPGFNYDGYYYFLASDSENIINDIYDSNLIFNRVDENTFQDAGDPPTITMVKQEGGPHPANYNCGVDTAPCSCPSISGYWYITGWDLEICETPSGLCVLENSNCYDTTQVPPYYDVAGCYRSLILYDYPVGQEGYPRGWNDGDQGKGYIDSEVHISMPSCVDANDFIAISSRWEFDVCGELAESGYYIPPIDGYSESFNFGKCTEPAFPPPTGWCCDNNVYCYECKLWSNNGTVTNNNPGNEPWRNCDLNTGTKFIGEGDWTNYKNWADANNNTPAVASAGADIITGQVRSTRGGWPSFGTLAGTIEIGFECGDMVVDGGGIVGGGFCQSAPPSPRTCTTFEFKNGGSISDVTLVSTGGGVLNTNSVINNGCEINTPSITVNDSTNDGIIFGLTSAAIFSGNSTNNGSVEGDAEFQDTSINNGTINGNATFKSGTKNYGTINGDATFEAGSCNSGTVTGTITGSPPAC